MLVRIRRACGIAACLGMLAAAAGAAWATASPATLQPVVLPRDHGAHPGFQVEWWYTAGTVAARGGHDLFWFATVWVAGAFRVARVNVVDLQADRVVLSREYIQLG